MLPTSSRSTNLATCGATDPATGRRFAVYRALIGWGSKLIRREILAAVRRRAETAGCE